jgi:hypothetical protein
MTMSFFVHLDDDNHEDSSTIKFGGWDKENVKSGEDIKFMRTYYNRDKPELDNLSWDL